MIRSGRWPCRARPGKSQDRCRKESERKRLDGGENGEDLIRERRSIDDLKGRTVAIVGYGAGGAITLFRDSGIDDVVVGLYRQPLWELRPNDRGCAC